MHMSYDYQGARERDVQAFPLWPCSCPARLEMHGTYVLATKQFFANVQPRLHAWWAIQSIPRLLIFHDCISLFEDTIKIQSVRQRHQ